MGAVNVAGRRGAAAVVASVTALGVLGGCGAATAQAVWCPGTSAEPAIRLDVRTSAAGAAPYVTLAPEDAEGPWLIDYGATATSVNRLADLPAEDPRWVGGSRTYLRLAGFDLPYAGQEQTVANLPREISEDGVGLQQGVIGTDLLSRGAVEFHYENPADQHVLITNGACDLANKGFFLFRQAGYFGSEPRHYAAQGVNVPVIFTRFEGPDGALTPVTPAQLDTGMADSVWPHTIYVNDAMWRTVEQGAVRVGHLGVLQCDGAASLEVWALPDTLLQITDETGFWMTKFPAYYVVPLPPAAPGSACGGIATMDVPMAQVGASFLRTFGTLVLDPLAYPDGGGVWIQMPLSPPIAGRAGGSSAPRADMCIPPCFRPSNGSLRRARSR